MRNSALLAAILRVAFPDARTILDPTWGNGSFWRGGGNALERYVVTGTDILAGLAPHGEADARALPHTDDSFDVTVFDPPHAADSTSGILAQRYGSFSSADIEALIRQGSRECYRVSRLGVIIKVTDSTHANRFIRQSGWVIDELGEPYDVVHRTRPRPLEDPKWGLQRHARSNGSTYLIYRKPPLETVTAGSLPLV